MANFKNFIIFLMVGIFALLLVSGQGCGEPISEPEPEPETKITSIEITSTSAEVDFQEEFSINWKISTSGLIAHTEIHYGTSSLSIQNVQSYPQRTETRCESLPCNEGSFSAKLSLTEGNYYYRAHAFINNTNYWSEEKKTRVIADFVKAKNACIAECRAAKKDRRFGTATLTSQCLSNEVTFGWACDVANNPSRPSIDDLPENQCSAYGKTIFHFIEITRDCQLIRGE